jgi:hypothetical protein
MSTEEPVLTRLREGIRKNSPELQALVSGRMPAFVLGGRGAAAQVPVFVFHEVEPERFQRQLQFLRSNGYRTLDSDELAEALERGHRPGRAVALTFDDASWSFWAFAFPLLLRYGFRAILFAIPGLVPEDGQHYPNLDDVAAGRCSLSDLYRRATIRPLCTWDELATMHASGAVDVQSHSATHVRVPIAPRLVDFLRPGYDPYWFGNVNVPLSVLDDPTQPERRLRLGAPVLKSAPRLAGRLRFREDPELVRALVSRVEAEGGIEFFRRRDWRRQLRQLWADWPDGRRGGFETAAEMEAAMRFELVTSRQQIEARLGKEVRHFCYPWFAGSPLADRCAADAGYRTVHYGILCPGDPPSAAPLRVARISEEYLMSLPGAGRSRPWSVWAERARRFVGRPRVASPLHGPGACDPPAGAAPTEKLQQGQPPPAA